MGQPAARKTDAVAHIKAKAGPIVAGSSNIFFNALPAARKGDKVQHDKGIEAVSEGEPSVLLNGMQAARLGDKVACGGVIAVGSGSIFIGRAKDEACLLDAAEDGAMLVESA
jgi:uncharacterized Zn-binding protein involved in type VI secretion